MRAYRREVPPVALVVVFRPVFDRDGGRQVTELEGALARNVDVGRLDVHVQQPVRVHVYQRRADLQQKAPQLALAEPHQPRRRLARRNHVQVALHARKRASERMRRGRTDGGTK